jgi:peptide subunit release factor 1 (eRF1)
MTTATRTPVDELLDRLAVAPPTELPVLSLYLDTRPNQNGREQFEPFLRKELKRRVGSYPPRTPARESVEADAARIEEFVRERLPKEANALALFACSAAGLFETMALDAAVGENRLFVGSQPHLYPLARLLDQYRRYAALVVDSHVARLFVFGLGTALGETDIESPKMRRTQVGGWSQMRYQRHVDHRHLKHAKEAAEALTRAVRDENIAHVVLAGEDVIVPLVREELPKDVAERIIDVVSLPVRTPEHEVLAATLESFRRHDAATDVETVGRLVDEYRGDGLAVVGLKDTLAALEAGQVDELVLVAAPIALSREEASEQAPALSPDELARREELAGDLVARARRTGASVRFIEDVGLLWAHEGVGAFLRYRLTPDTPVPPVDIMEPL